MLLIKEQPNSDGFLIKISQMYMFLKLLVKQGILTVMIIFLNLTMPKTSGNIEVKSFFPLIIFLFYDSTLFYVGFLGVCFICFTTTTTLTLVRIVLET